MYFRWNLKEANAIKIVKRPFHSTAVLVTIHKRRRQIFLDFWHTLPHVGSFLVPSVGFFDQILNPPSPSNCRPYLWTAPCRMSLGKQTDLTLEEIWVLGTDRVSWKWLLWHIPKKHPIDAGTKNCVVFPKV